MELILFDFIKAKRTPENIMSMEHSDFGGVLRAMSIGYFVSLVDRSSGGTNIPALWKALFPHKAKRIEQWEQESKQYLEILYKYRNECCFHANKSLVRQINTYVEYSSIKDEVVKLMQTFFDMATEILREDYKLDGLTERIEICSEKLNRTWPAFTPQILTKYIFGVDAEFHS